MKKYFLILGLLFMFCFQTFSQYNEARRIDSTRLDSLKKTLPLLKDSARVDVLNKIAIRFANFSWGGGFAHKNDSIRFYSSKAYEEATKIGYKSGIAMSLIFLSGFEAWENLPLGDTATKMKNMQKGIQLAEEHKNDEVLAWGYFYLGCHPLMKYDPTKFQEAWKKSIVFFLKVGDTLHAAEIYNWLCVHYMGTGELEKAYDYGKKGVELSKRSSTYISGTWHDFLVQFSLTDMADIYIAAGDYESAMNNITEANQYGITHNTDWLMYGNIVDLFCEMKQYDSALIYWNKWRNGKIFWTGTGLGYAAWANDLRGRIYLANKEYDKAIDIFRSCHDTLQKYPRVGYPIPMGELLLLGQAYREKGIYQTALKYTKEATGIAQQNKEPQAMMKCYELLSSVYHYLGNNDSAYEYLTKFHTIKDSIQSKQFLLRIYNSKKDAEVEKKQAELSLLDRDNKLKTQQLRQQSQLRNFLVIFILLLMLTGIFAYRTVSLKRKDERSQLKNALAVQKLESEKGQVELKQKAVELEMQALRAQMNPHFIFNCLSSINRIILKNETQAASDYLTRFSRLIRMVLINSQRSMIPLEDELQMLRLYLDMERMRFKNSFDYRITFANTIDEGAVVVPPLLLQPFCENAIWHGMMQKEGQGHLQIELSMEENILCCIISDDGIGREKAAELKTKSAEKEKSMGLTITAQRLELLNRNKNVQALYRIEDVLDENKNVAGTKVILKIGYEELTEQIV